MIYKYFTTAIQYLKRTMLHAIIWFKKRYKRYSILSNHKSYSLKLNPLLRVFLMSKSDTIIDVDTESDCTTTDKDSTYIASSSTSTPQQNNNTQTEPQCPPIPIYYPLFTSESHRYHHFTNSPIRLSKPFGIRIVSLYNYIHTFANEIPPTYFVQSYAIILSPFDIVKRYSDIVSTKGRVKAYIFHCDLDLFTSYMKSEAYYKLKHFCVQNNILIGSYVIQRSDNLFIPRPTFNQKRINAFDFHILDSSCQDKYSSILDIIAYFTQIGIPSNKIVVPFIPDAQINLKMKNLMGYFFRDDLCATYIKRIQLNPEDLAFP
jgi:hypothetical protein